MKHEELIKRLEVSCLGLDAVDPLRLLVGDVVLALRQTPQRTWVGLTDEEILSDDTLRYYYGMNGGAGPVSQKGKKVIAAIEAKLKQKNGYAEENT